jgi:hypothetical protein
MLMSPAKKASGGVRYPDFICIGAQKAGTTWLNSMLRQHPAIWMPPMKEIRYFDTIHLSRQRLPEKREKAALKAIQKSLASGMPNHQKLQQVYCLAAIGTQQLNDESYGQIFRAAGEDQLCGEVTPGYALLPDTGIEHMVRLNPHVKILFILRDPIDRAWSELRMTRPSPGIKDVEDALARPGFCARSDYQATLTRFGRFVPEERLLIMYFDDVADRPLDLLASLCGFLEIPSYEFQETERPRYRGASGEMDSASYNRLRETLRPTYEELLSFDNQFARRWYEKHYG